MSMQFYAHTAYFGPIGVNVTALCVSTAVLVIALLTRIRRKETSLLELGFLLLLLSFTFVTFHGRLLQFLFPIDVPEKPLIDNNLTFNYVITNIIVYAVIPLIIVSWRKRISLREVGIKASITKMDTAYIALGTIIATTIFLVTDHFFHQQWIQGYTTNGLILWVIFISIVSVSLQTLFYAGILFNRYIGRANLLLLALIVVFAFQSYAGPKIPPWQICSMLTLSTKLLVTWKTRNIYGALLISITTNLIELSLQI